MRVIKIKKFIDIFCQNNKFHINKSSFNLLKIIFFYFKIFYVLCIVYINLSFIFFFNLPFKIFLFFNIINLFFTKLKNCNFPKLIKYLKLFQFLHNIKRVINLNINKNQKDKNNSHGKKFSSIINKGSQKI